MTETEEQEWRERLADMARQAIAKKTAKRAERAVRKRQRDWGLRQRHAAKLAWINENRGTS
ncbi:hypothetical protein [Paractinoplanes hotanensis]|uniref:PH domain-containing protein n=1 Tax=Paractinoplanes hotanensis TaxID=2906497 RepID=A0ABT0Y4N5_9ACTN|nr:hypothetical protein [Actinoplanes hotanensis]MCM4080417.1 hypothetical protein [Actinoplanes hotanensis]